MSISETSERFCPQGQWKFTRKSYVYDTDDDSDSDTTTLSNSDIIMEDYYIFIYGVDAWNQIATAAGIIQEAPVEKYCYRGKPILEDNLVWKLRVEWMEAIHDHCAPYGIGGGLWEWIMQEGNFYELPDWVFDNWGSISYDDWFKKVYGELPPNAHDHPEWATPMTRAMMTDLNAIDWPIIRDQYNGISLGPYGNGRFPYHGSSAGYD